MADVYLWPVVSAASPDELAFVCHLLSAHGIGFTLPAVPDSEEGRRVLHDALLQSGGHAVLNVLRGHGPGWKDIVGAVARKLQIPADDLDPPALEQRIAARFIVHVLQEHPPDRQATAALSGLVGSSDTPEEEAAALISAFIEANRVPDDPAVFDDTISGMVRWLAGQGVRKELMGLAVRALLAGASGGVVSAVVGAVRLAGPAYRLTIPAVTWAALVRARIHA